MSQYWINSPKVRAVKDRGTMAIESKTAPRRYSWDKKSYNLEEALLAYLHIGLRDTDTLIHI